MVLGHSVWKGDVWRGLLGVGHEHLGGTIRAATVVFASCHLYEQPELSRLVATLTPAGWAAAATPGGRGRRSCSRSWWRRLFAAAAPGLGQIDFGVRLMSPSSEPVRLLRGLAGICGTTQTSIP